MPAEYAVLRLIQQALYKGPLNKSSSAERRIFCPIRAVLKTGNTYSIPLFSELSAKPKSSAASSCRFNQSFSKQHD